MLYLVKYITKGDYNPPHARMLLAALAETRASAEGDNWWDRVDVGSRV